MAKTRAQRKAERRKRDAQQQREATQARTDESRAQHDTQVPESAQVIEAELAEQGADLEALRGDDAATGTVETPAEAPPAPAPSRADVGRPPQAETGAEPSRRERRRAERERRERAKQSQARRERRDEPVERQRGAVASFIVSCWAELKRVQWPDRETLVQASAVTLIFIAVAAAYLGALDALFNQLVQLIL